LIYIITELALRYLLKRGWLNESATTDPLFHAAPDLSVDLRELKQRELALILGAAVE
jgi:hypothetical protein